MVTIHMQVCVLTLPLARRTDDGLPLAVPLDVFLVTSGGRRGRFPARGLLEEGWREWEMWIETDKVRENGCGVWGMVEEGEERVGRSEEWIAL